MPYVYYDFGALDGGIRKVDMTTGESTPLPDVFENAVRDIVEAPDGGAAVVTMKADAWDSFLTVSSLQNDTIVDFKRAARIYTGCKVIRTDDEYVLAFPLGMCWRTNGTVIGTDYKLEKDQLMPVYGRNVVASMFSAGVTGCMLSMIGASEVTYTPLMGGNPRNQFIVTDDAYYEFRNISIRVHDLRDGLQTAFYARDDIYHTGIVKQIDDNTFCEVCTYYDIRPGDNVTKTVLHDIRNLSRPVAELASTRSIRHIGSIRALFLDV